jgi:hypothetical protein
MNRSRKVGRWALLLIGALALVASTGSVKAYDDGGPGWCPPGWDELCAEESYFETDPYHREEHNEGSSTEECRESGHEQQV